MEQLLKAQLQASQLGAPTKIPFPLARLIPPTPPPVLVCYCSYTSSAGMDGVFTTRPAMDVLWGYEDTLLQLLVKLLPPGSLQDGPRVRGWGWLLTTWGLTVQALWWLTGGS